jgi:hypothetical protein
MLPLIEASTLTKWLKSALMADLPVSIHGPAIASAPLFAASAMVTCFLVKTSRTGARSANHGKRAMLS